MKKTKITEEEITDSLKLLLDFRRKAYTKGIEYELKSLEKFYMLKLHEVIHDRDDL